VNKIMMNGELQTVDALPDKMVDDYDELENLYFGFAYCRRCNRRKPVAIDKRGGKYFVQGSSAAFGCKESSCGGEPHTVAAMGRYIPTGS
jgi:hypothetical protein